MFSKFLPAAAPGSLAKFACSRLPALTCSLPAIFLHWLATLSPKETDLCGGQLRVQETTSVALLRWWKQKGTMPRLQRSRQ